MMHIHRRRPRRCKPGWVLAAVLAIAASGCARQDGRATASNASGSVPQSASPSPTQAAVPQQATRSQRVADGSYRKPSDEVLREKLSSEQYEITQENGTEPPFQNAYWDNKQPGLYVDIVSGEPLFVSLDKFKSGTGWPSFTQPVEPGRVVDISDTSHGMSRVEVRSKAGQAHLGHVFDDGPAPTGLRYCINSASLRFVPLAEMEKEGYGAYLSLFGEQASTSTEVNR